eukprot:m.8207 g.8207  ORF g.8207 m.8207 type:complete len:216 (-) comp3167_c0_seq1:91-738(-)
MAALPYFTPSEIAAHNCEQDLWVSYLGRVINLTPLAKQHKGNVLLGPLVRAAGTDISHWFNKKSQDLREHVDPVTGCTLPFTPQGRFLHVPPACPRSDWTTDFGRPWWKNDDYLVGKLSTRARTIVVVNTVTSEEQPLEVCAEETLHVICDRYLRYNSHAKSYTWKFLGTNLDMDKTLQENGVSDDADDMHQLSMDETQWLPRLHVYYNDDLTEG